MVYGIAESEFLIGEFMFGVLLGIYCHLIGLETLAGFMVVLGIVSRAIYFVTKD